MRLIDQGIVSNCQFNSPITPLFIFSKLSAFSFNNKIPPPPPFLEFCVVVFRFVQQQNFEMTCPISNLNK